MTKTYVFVVTTLMIHIAQSSVLEIHLNNLYKCVMQKTALLSPFETASTNILLCKYS